MGIDFHAKDAIFVRDRLGEYEVEQSYIDAHPNWFTCAGSVILNGQYRIYYILKADAPE